MSKIINKILGLLILMITLTSMVFASPLSLMKKNIVEENVVSSFPYEFNLIDDSNIDLSINGEEFNIISYGIIESNGDEIIVLGINNEVKCLYLGDHLEISGLVIKFDNLILNNHNEKKAGLVILGYENNLVNYDIEYYEVYNYNGQDYYIEYQYLNDSMVNIFVNGGQGQLLELSDYVVLNGFIFHLNEINGNQASSTINIDVLPQLNFE